LATNLAKFVSGRTQSILQAQDFDSKNLFFKACFLGVIDSPSWLLTPTMKGGIMQQAISIQQTKGGDPMSHGSVKGSDNSVREIGR